jgi:NADPH:quinone reductase-like Zn-dependent oxidoreductase
VAYITSKPDRGSYDEPGIMASLPTTMRAWRYTDASGGLERSMQLVDEPIPSAVSHPKSDHEVIKVHAMSLNPGDYKMAERSAILGALMSWALIRTPATPGLDFAGTIASGSREGTRVFGTQAWLYQNGTLAEYTQAMKKVLMEIPDGMSCEHAAALGTGIVTAYISLVPFVRGRKARQRVFVNGGSGGVGTFTIQVAKLLGCHVVASCSTRNVELCKSLGSDEILDYMTVEGRDIGKELSRRVREGTLQPFDLVIDIVGHDIDLHRKSDGFVKEGGQFILIAAMDETWAGVWSMAQSWLRPRWLGGSNTAWKFLLAYQDEDIVKEIQSWLAAGKIRIVVDDTFQFEDAPKAVAKLKTGKARGKIVVSSIAG